jgi:hypothetical protein
VPEPRQISFLYFLETPVDGAGVFGGSLNLGEPKSFVLIGSDFLLAGFITILGLQYRHMAYLHPPEHFQPFSLIWQSHQQQYLIISASNSSSFWHPHFSFVAICEH